MPLRNLLLVSFIILLAFLADRLSKLWASMYLADHGPVQFHPLLAITEVHNSGIGFGLLPGAGSAVGWLTIAIVVALFVWLMRTPDAHALTIFGLALLIGGALGNMFDRIVVGQVLDFISTPLWPRVLNVADLAIRLGAVLVLVGFAVQGFGRRHSA